MITTNMDDVIKQFNTFIARKEAQIKKLSVLTPRQVGQVIKTEIMKSIVSEKLVASGDLLKSISVTGLRASTQMSEETVGSSSPYARFVEEGVRAGGRMPPRDKIYDWMIQKGMQPSERGAFLIAKKISETGIPARKPFEKGIENAESKIEHEIQILVNKTITKD